MPEPGSRFDDSKGNMGSMYRARYLKDGYFQALPLIKEVAVSTMNSSERKQSSDFGAF